MKSVGAPRQLFEWNNGIKQTEKLPYNKGKIFYLVLKFRLKPFFWVLKFLFLIFFNLFFKLLNKSHLGNMFFFLSFFLSLFFFFFNGPKLLHDELLSLELRTQYIWTHLNKSKTKMSFITEASRKITIL